MFHSRLHERIGPNGQLVALDLSLPAKHLCRRDRAKAGVHWVLGNAEYLPFENATFDLVFHFGGINLFEQAQRAVNEMVRVAKPGAIVAYGDEELAKRYPEGWRKFLLQRVNPTRLRERPNQPRALVEAQEHAIYGGLGYLTVGKRFWAPRAPIYVPTTSVLNEPKHCPK